jgi:hypothetical protein
MLRKRSAIIQIWCLLWSHMKTCHSVWATWPAPVLCWNNGRQILGGHTYLKTSIQVNVYPTGIPHPQCLDQMWGISPPSASCMPGSTKCGTGYRYMSHKSHTASFLTCIFNFESFRKFILWGISFPLRFPFSWFLASIIFQSSWLTTYGPGCLHALSQN